MVSEDVKEIFKKKLDGHFDQTEVEEIIELLEEAEEEA